MCVGMCVCVHMSGYSVWEGEKLYPPNNEPFFTPFLLFHSIFLLFLLLYPEEGGWGKRKKGWDGGREEKRCRSMMGREWGEKMVDKIDCGMWDVNVNGDCGGEWMEEWIDGGRGVFLGREGGEVGRRGERERSR